jgi:hypothetical protein
MTKQLEVKLQLNKQTIARLDPKAMKKNRVGFFDVSTTSDKNSKGSNCSCVCCAITLS